jgi:hypothetical protein
MRPGARRVCVGFVGVACVLGVAPVAAQADFLAPDARIFTLGGGGRQEPREGLPAVEATGFRDVLAAMPDGSIATVAHINDPLLIGLDGRIHMLPPVDYEIASLAAGRDGSLFAVPYGGSSVYRLAPGAAAWSQILDQRPGIGGVRGVVGAAQRRHRDRDWRRCAAVGRCRW